MRWRQKALVQNALARLPSGPGYRLHYLLQRSFGRLRAADPVETLKAGARWIAYLHDRGRSVEGARVLELGTGRQLNLPLVFWLAGAQQIITVDKNPYLKEEMVLQDLAYMRRNTDGVLDLLRPAAAVPGFRDRFAALLDFRGDLEQLLQLARIRYLAPADAANLPLPPGSVDYHVSFSVVQHVPPGILEGILLEGRRLLAPGGLLLCYTNMTDHFAHDDETICLVNFLAFDEEEWMRLAGNKFMYQNRLRVDDLLRLLGRMGYRLELVESKVDERSLKELERGLTLDKQFAGKARTVNATTGAWVIARPAGGASGNLVLEAENLCGLLAANQRMSFRYAAP